MQIIRRKRIIQSVRMQPVWIEVLEISETYGS